MVVKRPAAALASLPDDCVIGALLFLDVQDALHFRQTCHRMNLLLEQSQDHYWLPRLQRDFGLQLQVPHGQSGMAVILDENHAGAQYAIQQSYLLYC